MHHSVRTLLQKIGIAPQAVENLTARILSPSPGTFDPSELDNATAPCIGLLAAIIAASDYQRFHRDLKILLAFVKSEASELSLYDQARLSHLEGVATWREEGSIYFIEKALNLSIAILQQLGSPKAQRYLPRVFDTFGQFMHHQGLLKEARREFEVALQSREAVQDEPGTALTLGNLGRLCMDMGDFSAACDYLRRDLEIIRRISPEALHLQTQLLSHLGTCHLGVGNLDEAREYFCESSALAAKSKDHLGLFFGALGMGRIALQNQDLSLVRIQAETALGFLEKADISDELRDGLKGYLYQLSAELHLAAGEVSRAVEEFELAWAHLSQTPDLSPVEMAHLLRGYAKAAHVHGEHEKSTRLLREALQHLDSTTADSLRVGIEEELRNWSRDSWLLHSAGRFVGHQQIEFLLDETGRGGFRGANKELTILFSDIRGFTTFSEKLSPAEIITFLNEYLSHMTRCVQHFGGMVDKFIGDAVMALFSLPDPKNDDAECAAMAALMMRSEVECFNRKLPAGIPKLSIGIGLHYGSVVAGLIGSPQKRSYTVIGDAVNTASRLEGMTKTLGGSILVSREVVQQLPNPDRFLLRPLGKYLPKGRERPVEIFDLMDLKDDSRAAAEARLEIQKMEMALDHFSRRDFPEALEQFVELASSTAHTRREIGYYFLAEKTRELLQNPRMAWNEAIPLTEK